MDSSLLAPSAFLTTAFVALAAATGAPPTGGQSNAPPTKGVVCTKYASPKGSDTARGTKRSPFETAQRLADSLHAGQVGCLHEGAYRASGEYVLRLGHGGTAGAPLTIRSYPGEQAELRGIVYVVSGTDHVRLTNLRFVGNDEMNAIKIYSTDVVVADNDITNLGSHQSCMILGSNSGYGEALHTTVRGNRVHDCGSSELDHAIYFANSGEAVVVNNVIWNISGYAMHLYPNAQHTLIAHNVIDGTGRGGVIFAGEGDLASNNNVVEQNIISDSSGSDIRSYWGGSVGTGNVARRNCVWASSQDDVAEQEGFVAERNVVADPRYANRAHHDFRLRLTSRCLRVVGYDTAALLARR